MNGRGHVERGQNKGRSLRMGAADEERRSVQPRLDRRHHRYIDIAPARRIEIPGGALLGLGRARVAVEKERAHREARQRGDRRFMRLIGGDDGKDDFGARDRLGRARRPDHAGCDIVGAHAGARFRIGRIDLDVVSGNPRSREWCANRRERRGPPLRNR